MVTIEIELIDQIKDLFFPITIIGLTIIGIVGAYFSEERFYGLVGYLTKLTKEILK